MSIATKTLEELIHDLPPSLQSEVRDFVELLLIKRKRSSHLPLRQDWAGALEAYKSQYTSVELQHLALEWRGN